MNNCVKNLFSASLLVFVAGMSSAANFSDNASSVIKSDSLIKRMPTDSLIAIQNRKLTATERKLKENTGNLQRLRNLNDQKINELKVIERQKSANSPEYRAKMEEIMTIGGDIDRLAKSPKTADVGDRVWRLDDVEVLKGFDWGKVREKSKGLLKDLDLDKLNLKGFEKMFEGKNWKDITLGEAQDKAGDIAGKVRDKIDEAQKTVKKNKSKLSDKDQKKLDTLNKELEELDKKRNEILKKKADVLKPQFDEYLDLGSDVIKSFGDVFKGDSVTVFQNGKVVNGGEGEVKYYLNSKEITKKEYDSVDPKTIVSRGSSFSTVGGVKTTKYQLVTK